MSLEEIISDKEIDKVWGGANFGHNDRRGQILKSLTQRALGYHTGHTITCIMLNLGLIQVKNLGVDFEEDIKSYHLTQKGLDYLNESYAQQRVNEVFKTLKDLVEKNPHHDGYHESKLKTIELIKSIENEK